jgi:hypothetical protein
VLELQVHGEFVNLMHLEAQPAQQLHNFLRKFGSVLMRIGILFKILKALIRLILKNLIMTMILPGPDPPMYNVSPKINGMCNNIFMELKHLQVTILLVAIQGIILDNISILPLHKSHLNLQAIGPERKMLSMESLHPGW